MRRYSILNGKQRLLWWLQSPVAKLECSWIYYMSHSTSNRTVFDLYVTDFYKTFYRHSTNKNAPTVSFLTSQSNISVDKKYQNF